MSVLDQVCHSVEAHDNFVERQVARARSETPFRDQILERWQAARAGIGTVATPTGLKLPRLALPQTNEPGEITRYLYGEGLPGEFPFLNAAYPEMYLETGEMRVKAEPRSRQANRQSEEPTRLFAGLGLAEDTNRRFHYLTRQQNNIREIRSLRRWQFSQQKNPTIEPVAQALRGPSVDPAALAGFQQGEKLLQKALEIAVQTTRASVGIVHRPLPPHIGLVTACVHGPGLRQNLGEVVPWNDDARLVAHGDDALLGQPDQDDWARCSARRLSTVAHPRVSGVAVVPVTFGETRGLIELGRYDHAFRQTDLDVLEELSDSIVDRLKALCD